MNVLLCHNHYQYVGGEDHSFEDEARLLEAHGHKVVRFTVHNNQIKRMSRLRTALRTIWNADIYHDLRKLIRVEQPQVMHCTNTFPLISPAAYYAARREGVPVVQSLRNYRLLCANALFLRNGTACEKCLGKTIPWPALVHRCYRYDLSATATVAMMVGAHRAAGTWRRAVDLYFTPSEFARQKFIAGGFNGDRIAVKPNFVFPDPGPGTGNSGVAVFVGRLSQEKGIDVLLDAWLNHNVQMPLKIIGDGPLEARVRDAVVRCPRINWLGHLPKAEALKHVGDAAVLVFPSITYETFGRTVAEAFAKGTPVLASDSGASAELVTGGITGSHFRAGDASDLAAKIAEFAANPARLAQMRAPARQEYVEKYNGQLNYEKLIAIYERAIDIRRRDIRERNGRRARAAWNNLAGPLTAASTFTLM